MSKVFFDGPMTLAGSEQEQLKQLYSYLFTMSEKLNEAMNTISEEQMEDGLKVTISQIEGTQQAVQTNYTSLKSMIIKTAEIVRHEMEEIRASLHEEYTAVSSAFGTLEETMDATITARATGIMQEYNYDERILDVANGLETYRQSVSQYIFSGLIDEVIVDGNNQKRYGIAIGNNVTARDGDGNESLNRENMIATFTMEELAFYTGGVKVAWFSNQNFYIESGEIVNQLKIGANHMWKILSDGSIALISNGHA